MRLGGPAGQPGQPGSGATSASPEQVTPNTSPQTSPMGSPRIGCPPIVAPFDMFAAQQVPACPLHVPLHKPCSPYPHNESTLKTLLDVHRMWFAWECMQCLLSKSTQGLVHATVAALDAS